MGAEQFITERAGDSAAEAFNDAVEAAQWDYGHAGYTGTIAEKYSFEFVHATEMPLTEAEAYAFAEKMLDEDDPRISDKWGPAGAIKMDGNRYLFFGWASS